MKKGCTLQGVTRGEYRFTRRQLREALAHGDTQLKVHLSRLLELEYLRATRGRDGGFEYVLLYESSAEGGRFFPGLVELSALHNYDASRSGSDPARSASEGARSAPGRPAVGGRSAPGRGGSEGELSKALLHLAAIGEPESETAHQERSTEITSYPQAV